MSRSIPWRPRRGATWIDLKTGKLRPDIERFIDELEFRLGGISGPTVTEVSTAATTATAAAATADAKAADALTYAGEVATYSGEVRTQSEALRVVAVDNALTGAGDVPPDPGDPPTYDP